MNDYWDKAMALWVFAARNNARMDLKAMKDRGVTSPDLSKMERVRIDFQTVIFKKKK